MSEYDAVQGYMCAEYSERVCGSVGENTVAVSISCRAAQCIISPPVRANIAQTGLLSGLVWAVHIMAPNAAAAIAKVFYAGGMFGLAL